MVSQDLLESYRDTKPQLDCLWRFAEMYHTLDVCVFLPVMTTEFLYINQRLRWAATGTDAALMFYHRLEALKDEPLAQHPVLSLAMVDGFLGREPCLACYVHNSTTPTAVVTIEMDGPELSIITYSEILPFPRTADVVEIYPGLSDEEAQERLMLKPDLAS